MMSETKEHETINLTTEVTEVLEEIVEMPPIKEEKEKPNAIYFIDEDTFLMGDKKYRLVLNYRDAFQPEKLSERYSDILNRYDYIVADWGYEQLRLKGFFDSYNRKAPADQRIDALEDYLYEFCNFGCAFFVIERLGGKKERKKTRHRKKKSQEIVQEAFTEEKVETTKVVSKKKPIIKKRTEKVEKEAMGETKERVTTTKRHFTIRQKNSDSN